MKVEFGVFDHVDRGETSLAALYESRLTLASAYDAAGFRTYHVAEHHATSLGMAPSPGVYLAAVAQRTRRLRFGPLVYILPLYTPLRLIEEICMLDQMSGGRLDIGFGRGSSPIEVSLYGVNAADAQRIYMEALEVVLAGLTSDDRRTRAEAIACERGLAMVPPFDDPFVICSDSQGAAPCGTSSL